jgi:hypothetical protein
MEWGEPALTIVDVRPRDQFNDSHILGAIDFSLDQLGAIDSRNALMADVHDRMPMILDPDHYDQWLNIANSNDVLFRPYPAIGEPLRL